MTREFYKKGCKTNFVPKEILYAMITLRNLRPA